MFINMSTKVKMSILKWDSIIFTNKKHNSFLTVLSFFGKNSFVSVDFLTLVIWILYLIKATKENVFGKI